ncbi:MAG TPA: (Fe-S)-binding protein [Xanthomonadaceae bacterium]|jgi:glycolate oxidase iron-sulfur subunit
MSFPAPADARSSGRAIADPLIALADRCVQCGLCLPHCPTYRLDRAETESPRGRIALARGLADGSLIPDPIADAHLDHCLGCRRCEAVCPAGVAYGELLVEVRQRQRQRRQPSRSQRALEWLTARPLLLDRLLGAYRVLYRLLPRGLRSRLLQRPPSRTRIDAARHDAGDVSPPRVALFLGCVARRYDGDTHAALAKLCHAAGIDVVVPQAQTCCGAVHAHAGNTNEASDLAQRNRAAFAAAIPVLTTATGCHESIAVALADHAPVHDACVFLLAHAERLRFRPSGTRVALHVPCTQRAVVKSDKALRTLLSRIPQLDLVELRDTGCCGAAGTYMFDQPARATALRRPVLDAFAASGASLLLSANIGCRLHLSNGAPVRVQHPLEFLAGHLVETAA